jgi:phosphoribosyl-AMP cyclohydrolase / phosphoribosyl-ATP pyrophosphohydrolase
MRSDAVATLETAIAGLDWAKGDGLLPVVVQDADSLRVLMLGYMDAAALAATRERGLVTFYSRSKQRLWTKGESSGNVLTLVSIDVDCDNDTLLVLARPKGPTCHTGRTSCFPQAPGLAAAPDTAAAPGGVAFLGTLDALVATRERERPFGSYTTSLFEKGTRRIAQKVGEEGVETALAGVAQGDEELLGESADLLYHLVVLLRARGLSLADAVAVLEARYR